MIMPNEEGLAETAKRAINYSLGEGTWERLPPTRQQAVKNAIWRNIHTYLTIMRQKDWLFINIDPPTAETTFQEPPSETPAP